MTTYEHHTFKFHCDSGHGWLEVPYAAAMEVGLSISAFSTYSYFDHGAHTLFLEEDCDATKFDHAFKDHFGHSATCEECFIPGNHWVRKLSRLPELVRA